MVLRVSTARSATVLAVLLGALTALTGCGSTATNAPAGAAPTVTAVTTSFPTGSCTATALATLGKVLEHVYNEGVSSEATHSARYLIEHSSLLRKALESGNRAQARLAARQLIATGHMTNLSVARAGKELVAQGEPAMTPLSGQLTDSKGALIGSYLASVFSDQIYDDEAKGLAHGLISVRSGDHVLAGTSEFASGELGTAGTLTRGGVRYQYVSFPAAAYPSGSLRIYLFRTEQSLRPLCRSGREGTVVQTLRQVANLIYKGESGTRAREQVRRVQLDAALLAAVARRDRAATRGVVAALLHQHVVRLRVTAADGTPLDDLGGPYVMAPLHAPLRLNGRTIGKIELSVQDDEGYKRLLKRLAGVDVVMLMNGAVVKNSLGPLNGPVPSSGPYRYRGRNFEVFTVDAQAFPSGPLTVRVLVPDPYL
jgi:hypothetical protein